MRVRVRLFAGIRDVVGAAVLDMEAPEGGTVADVLAQLERAHPRLAAYRAHMLLAVDGESAMATRELSPGSVVALMPPVSGGSLHAAPLDEATLRAALRTEGAGAVVTFLGLARDEGGTVQELRFEAYDEMAERELARVRDEAIAKFGLVGCVIHHRTGAVGVGAPAVGVATSARHRRQAFDAAAWVMDELKSRVPIWKREVSAEGDRWVNDPSTQRNGECYHG
ncbi:MAG: molybdenum cofactor biosynthesis protein MoaE [Candidatus Thermoplasmatota archaeon]